MSHLILFVEILTLLSGLPFLENCTVQDSTTGRCRIQKPISGFACSKNTSFDFTLILLKVTVS